MDQKNNNKKVFALVIFLLLVGGGVFYFFYSSPVNELLIKKPNITSQDNNEAPLESISNSDETTTCDSGKVPGVKSGEQIVESATKDLDSDGKNELLVIYGNSTSGWEGMPDLSYRLAVFSCKEDKYYKLHDTSVYSSPTFNFIQDEKNTAVFVGGGYQGWALLVKNGESISELKPTQERLKELEGRKIIYLDGYKSSAKVVDNLVREVIPGFAENDPRCCPSLPEVGISYAFKDNRFTIVKSGSQKKITVNGIDFKYPDVLSCNFKSTNGQTSTCDGEIINSHIGIFSFNFPGAAYSFSFRSIDPTDAKCINWMKGNNYQIESCISFERGKNYIVYSEGNTKSIREVVDEFIVINK